MSDMDSVPQSASALRLIQKWLEGHIEEDQIMLKRPQAGNKAGGYNLAAPAVHLGLVPPDSILDPDGDIRIPCLVVGISESNGDSEEELLNLRITAIVYDPGTQSVGTAALEPNFEGYTILLNLLDRVRAWVLREDGAAKRFQLEGSVKLSPYEEQPWPYWYGSLSFMVSDKPYPLTKYDNVLN